MMSKTAVRVSWGFQIVSGLILLQTLFFKFTGAPESVYIFDQVGFGSVGRIGSGVVELAAAMLLLAFGRTASLGGFVAGGTTVGAIAAHLTVLGIEVQGDGGTLFALALTVFASSGAILFLRRHALQDTLASSVAPRLERRWALSVGFFSLLLGTQWRVSFVNVDLGHRAKSDEFMD